MASRVLVIVVILLASITVLLCAGPATDSADRETVIALLHDTSRCPRSVAALVHEVGGRSPRVGEEFTVLGLLWWDHHGYPPERRLVRRVDAMATDEEGPSGLLSHCLAYWDPAAESPPTLTPDGLRDLVIRPQGICGFAGSAEYLVCDAYVAKISFTGGPAEGAWVLHRIWLTDRPWGVMREGDAWVYYEDR